MLGVFTHYYKETSVNIRNSIGLAGLVVASAVSATILAPTANAEISYDICPSGNTGVATADTSCAFAESVRVAWYSQPGNTIIAHSPVTNLFYTLQCESVYSTSTWYEAKRCFGVNSYGDPLLVYVD